MAFSVAAGVAEVSRVSHRELAEQRTAYVVQRLEEAGRTLLALPPSGYALHLRTGHPEIVHDAATAYGWRASVNRPAVPSARAITDMDETLRWLTMIPLERPMVRRIVGLRMLVHPVTERHLYSWRRIGHLMHLTHPTARARFDEGASLIAKNVRCP